MAPALPIRLTIEEHAGVRPEHGEVISVAGKASNKIAIAYQNLLVWTLCLRTLNVGFMKIETEAKE